MIQGSGKKNNSRLVNHQTVTQPHFLSFANTNETKLTFFTAHFSQRFYFLLHFSSAPQNTGRRKQELMFRHHKLAVFFCFGAASQQKHFLNFSLTEINGSYLRVRRIKGPVSRYQKPGTRNQGPKVPEFRNQETRKWGTKNQEPRVHETGNNFRNQEPGTRDQRPNQEYKSSGVQEIGTRDQGPEVQEFMNQESRNLAPNLNMTWQKLQWP